MEKLEARWPLLKGLTISLFFLYFYIKGIFLGGSEIYSRLDLVFGVYYHILILYPLILGFSKVLNKRKEAALKIRLFSSIFFFFFCVFLIIMRELESSIFIGVDLEQELVRRSWTELNLGGLSTTVMHYLYFNIEKTYLYRILVGGIGITSLILFTKSITNSVRWVVKLRAEQLERRALKSREEELKTKIKIKEEIDEKMSLKKEKNLKSHEEKIQQEVEIFMKNTCDKPKETETIRSQEEEVVEGEVISLEELLEYAKKQVAESTANEEKNKEEKKCDDTDNEIEGKEKEAEKEQEQEKNIPEETDDLNKVEEVEQEKLKSLKDEESDGSSDKEKVQ